LPPSSSELAERKALFYHLLLQNGGANIGPDCGFPQRQPEFRALTVLLETAFGV
jgi:hypothetical protein